jgi:hypothetical protein
VAFQVELALEGGIDRTSRGRPTPASAERVTVSCERPHSTGVESMIQTSWVHKLVSVATARMAWRSSNPAPRRRLL